MLQKTLLLSLLTLLLVISGFTFSTPSVDKGGKAKAEKINWLTLEEAEAKVKKQPKKVVIDVYTDWCGWCKKMDKSTFTDPAVVEYINKNYYAVKLNAEDKNPITIGGKTYTYNPQYKAHEVAVALLQGRMSYPTTVYLDEKFNILTPVPGYIDAPTLTRILTYFGGDHYKSMSWEEFEKKK